MTLVCDGCGRAGTGRDREGDTCGARLEDPSFEVEDPLPFDDDWWPSGTIAPICHGVLRLATGDEAGA